MTNTAFQFTEINGKITTKTIEVLHDSDLNPHDIKCGRGSGPNEYCGNKNFLELVATRRDEYLATKSRIVKARIAQEVVDEIHNLEPPGRFLERARRKNKKGESLWIVVTNNKKCTEKVKQACRETWHRKDSGSGIKYTDISIEPIHLKLGNKRKEEVYEDIYPAKKTRTSFTYDHSQIHNTNSQRLYSLHVAPFIRT